MNRSMRRGDRAGRMARLVGAVAVVALCGAAVPAWAQQTTPPSAQVERRVTLDIPAQDLNAALLAFADKAGVQLFYDVSRVQGLRSKGVTGTLPLTEALAKVLDGTGLTYQFTSPTAITLVKLPQTGAVTPLAPLVVEGQGDAQDPKGAGVGYVATRSAGGTKTDTPILEIPQTVNVVPAEQIRDQGAQSVSQALRYTPGVMTETYGATSPFDIYTQIRGFRAEQYLDGLRLPDHDVDGTSSSVIEPYSLERVEVLKGPSSGLYGQTPPGGILSMESKRPTDTPYHQLEFQAGNFDHYQGAFDFGGPVTSDGSVLYRLTGLGHSSGSQVDFTHDNRAFVAPAVTFGANSDTTLTLLSRYQRDWGNWPYFNYLPASGSLLHNDHGDIPTSRYLGEPDFDEMHRQQYLIGYDFSHDFNDKLTFRQNFRYGNTKFDTLAVVPGRFDLDADGRTLERLGVDLDSKSQSFTVDTNLEAKADTGPLAHDMLFGVDYQHQVSHYRFFAGLASPIDIYDPDYGQPIGDMDIGIQDSRTRLDQIGVYAQDQIKFGGWIATVGLRHDWVDGHTTDDINAVNVKPSDGAFSGRGGLTYVFSNGIAPYFSYSRSFRPQAGTDFEGQPFKPTTGEQYEAGIKYQPTGTNLLITASAFNVVEQNRLTSDPDPAHPFAQVQQGEVRVRGVELEGRAEPLPGLSIIGSYAFLDSKVTKSNTEGEEGLKLFATPEHQASLWADYVLQSGDLAGLGFGAGMRYVGVTYDTSNTLKIPDYALFDATIHYDLGGLSPKLDGVRLMLNAQNLFDKKYVSSCDGSTMCTYGFRRTVMGTISYSW